MNTHLYFSKTRKIDEYKDNLPSILDAWENAIRDGVSPSDFAVSVGERLSGGLGEEQVKAGDFIVLLDTGAPDVQGRTSINLVAVGVAKKSLGRTNPHPNRKIKDIMISRGMGTTIYELVAPKWMGLNPLGLSYDDQRVPSPIEWGLQGEGIQTDTDLALLLCQFLDTELTQFREVILEKIQSALIDSLWLNTSKVEPFEMPEGPEKRQFLNDLMALSKAIYGHAGCYICGMDSPEVVDFFELFPYPRFPLPFTDNCMLVCSIHKMALTRKFYEVDVWSWPYWEITHVDGHSEAASLVRGSQGQNEEDA